MTTFTEYTLKGIPYLQRRNVRIYLCPRKKFYGLSSPEQNKLALKGCMKKISSATFFVDDVTLGESNCVSLNLDILSLGECLRRGWKVFLEGYPIILPLPMRDRPFHILHLYDFLCLNTFPRRGKGDSPSQTCLSTERLSAGECLSFFGNIRKVHPQPPSIVLPPSSSPKKRSTREFIEALPYDPVVYLSQKLTHSHPVLPTISCNPHSRKVYGLDSINPFHSEDSTEKFFIPLGWHFTPTHNHMTMLLVEPSRESSQGRGFSSSQEYVIVYYFDPVGENNLFPGDVEKYVRSVVDLIFQRLWGESDNTRDIFLTITSPKVSFQSIETLERGKSLEGRGSCSLWCVWFIDVCSRNSSISPSDVIGMSLRKIPALSGLYGDYIMGWLHLLLRKR